MSSWLEFSFVFIASLLFIRLLIAFASSLRLVDEPNRRSSHVTPTPRGGGIVFSLAALFSLSLFRHHLFFAHLPEIIALGMIIGIGILDDRHEARPRLKFLVIALATLALWDGGVIIDDVGRYLGVEIHLDWLAVPFTFFAVAGFTNALNLIDGIDGLAGVLSLIILTAFGILGWIHHDPFLWNLSLVFSAGLFAFLLFNWHPASLFMGDSGSLTLGFLIAMLSIHALTYLPSVSVLYFGAVPILDTLVAILRRKHAGRSASAPDRCHFHHLLLQKTGSVPQTVLLMAGIQGIFLLIGLSWSREMDQALPLILFLMLVGAAYLLVERWIRTQGIDCYPE